ncbi:MAG TPA: hypothetical protein VM510_00855 [Caulifigura sp.]|nr:hypothetical protein [Caulifigura sp.]
MRSQRLLIMLTLLFALFGRVLFAADGPKEDGASPAAAAIAKLLMADVDPRKVQVDSIRPLYRSALAVAPRDPRLEYAFFLVLQRMFQPTEAREHLNRALEIDPGFPPANQAHIRELLKSRQFSEALDRIRGFAARLDPNRGDSRDSAEWLGRIIAAVSLVLGTPDAQSTFAAQDRVLRASLPPVLRSRYEAGYASVEQDLEMLSDALNEARATAKSKNETEKAKTDAELAKDQEEIKRKQQEAAKTRKKWDEWIADQTSKADEILKDQEKRYQELERTAAAQIESIAAMRGVLNRADLSFFQSGMIGNPNPFIGSFAVSNRSQIELALAVEERRLALIYDQQAAVSNAANQTLAARRQAVAQYQKATGAAMKDAAQLDRWEKRNQAIAENQRKAAEKKPAQVAMLESKMKSLMTWDPADFQSEKYRLLGDLGVPLTVK